MLIIPLLVGLYALAFGFMFVVAVASSMMQEYRPFTYNRKVLANLWRDTFCLGGGASSVMCGIYLVADVIVRWLS